MRRFSLLDLTLSLSALKFRKPPINTVNQQSRTNLAMSIWNPLSSRVSMIFLVCYLFLSCFPGLISSAVLTLGSIEIYKTHELLKALKPSVYFCCKGENKTELPDVKESHLVYNFKGEESWQPLTELLDKKCKRCGFYEADTFKSDDVFDEWELCPSDFEPPNGKYIRFKEKELNATFLCPECIKLDTPSNAKSESTSSSNRERKGKVLLVALIIFISSLVSTVVIIGLVVAFKYWQKKKREQDQARFLKLFEEGDDIEGELALGAVI